MIDKSCEYFERAAIETKIILEKIPKASTSYINQDDEDIFLSNLSKKDSKTYCWYILYKVYHFIVEFYKIKLNKFIAEFNYDCFGNIWFTNVILIDVCYSDAKILKDKEEDEANEKAAYLKATTLKKKLTNAQADKTEEKNVTFKATQEDFLESTKDSKVMGQKNTKALETSIVASENNSNRYFSNVTKKQIMNRLMEFEEKKRMAKTL